MAKLNIDIVCIDCKEQMKIAPNTGWPGVIAAFGQFGVDHNNDSGMCMKAYKNPPKEKKLQSRKKK